MTTPLADLVGGLECLEVDETLDVMVGLQRAQSRLAWAQYQALLRVAGPYQRTEEVLVFDRRVGIERVVEVTDEVRDEVAAALHRSPTLVHDQITTARLLNGPLSATARALRDGQVTAQVDVLDPQTGIAIALGRTRYEVSDPLRRWIAARDRTCRFTGCRRRATACQVDHIDPWDDYGPTDAANLQALCARHHQLKTHRGWRATRDPATRRTHWTSPLGRTYLVDPEPVLVKASAAPPPEPDPFPS